MRLAGRHVLDRRQDPHGHTGFLRGTQRAVDELGGRVRNGQQHLLDGVATGGGGDVLDASDHGHADERQAVTVPVVVEDRHRHEAGDGSATHLPDGLGAGVAAADDRHPESHQPRAALPREEPRLETQAPHRHGHERAADEHDPERDPLEVDHAPHRTHRREQDDGDGGRQQHLPGLLDAGVAPDATVEAEHPVGAEVDHESEDQEQEEVLPVLGGRPVPQVGDLGHAVAGRDGQDVEDHEQEPGPDVGGLGGEPVPPERQPAQGDEDARGCRPETLPTHCHCHAICPPGSGP